MNSNHILIIVLTLAVAGSIGYINYSHTKKDADFVRALDSNPKTFDRNIIQNDFSTDLFADSSSILSPAQIRIRNDHTYLNDFTDFTIYEYNEQGNQTRALTTSRGRGPGEVQHVTDFDVSADTLWIVDSQNMRATSYLLSTGETLHTFNLDKRPMRITTLNDGLIIQWLGSDYLFSKFDFEGNEIKQFGEIVEDQQFHQISLDGTIRSNGKDRFVYIPFYASLIYHYRSDGELINVLQTPDGVEFPKAQRDGATTFAPDFSYMRDAYIDENDQLYVYTRVPEETANGISTDQTVSYLDKYDLRQAEYLQSLRMDHHFSSVMYNPATNIIYSSNMEYSQVHTLLEDF